MKFLRLTEPGNTPQRFCPAPETLSTCFSHPFRYVRLTLHHQQCSQQAKVGTHSQPTNRPPTSGPSAGSQQRPLRPKVSLTRERLPPFLLRQCSFYSNSFHFPSHYKCIFFSYAHVISQDAESVHGR